MTPTRSLHTTLALGLAALLVGGCPTTKTPKTGGTPSTTLAGQNDSAGDLLADGIVKIAAVDRGKLATEGKVAYTLENVSDEHQENLLYYVLFTFPPTPQQVELGLKFDAAATNETPLNLPKGRSRTLEVPMPPGRWKGKGKTDLPGTKIAVLRDEFVPTVRRSDDGDPGTRFMFDSLECTDFNQQRPAGAFKIQSMSIEFMNVSNPPRRVSDLEMRVIFVDIEKNQVGRTEWGSLPTFAPGERKKVPVNLQGVAKVTDEFWVKIRAAEL